MKTMPPLSGLRDMLKCWGDKGFNHLFQGGRIPGRFLFKPVEQSQALLVGRHRAAQNHGFQKRFFGVKVVMDRSQIHARLGNDAAQGSSGVALCGKQPLGGIEDALFGVVHRRLNQTYDSDVRL